MIFPQRLTIREDFLTQQFLKIQQNIEEENYKEIEDTINYIYVSKDYHDLLDEEKCAFLETAWNWALVSQNKFLEAFEKIGSFKILKQNVSFFS